jgi:NADH:ubiquinone oxidoreductase subunit 3 (subunit A)
MSQWIYIGLFFLVGLIIPVGAIAAAWVLGPRKPNPIKQTTYECGIETVGESWVQFKAQYYIFALVFLIFDVETVFLFPWAVRLGQLGLFAVVEGIIFILILIFKRSRNRPRDYCTRASTLPPTSRMWRCAKSLTRCFRTANTPKRCC